MRPDTIRRAQAALPATREELAQRLGCGAAWAGQVAAHLIQHQYAREWGSKLTAAGTLAPILEPTEKRP